MPEPPDFDQIEAQAAAPPVVPPKRPIVGAAMADDDRPWLQDLDRCTRQLTTLVEQINAAIAAHQAPDDRTQ